MSNFNLRDCFEGRNPKSEFVVEDVSVNEDLIMEQILENINTTPIGQVLKKIASLPEIRRAKVLNVRQQITQGHYDLNNRLEVALDKVLEDLTM
jgi:hypothetical protein